MAATYILMLTLPYWPRTSILCFSLCKLNLRPKNPEGCQPAYRQTRLPLYDTNGSCMPYLNFSFVT